MSYVYMSVWCKKRRSRDIYPDILTLIVRGFKGKRTGPRYKGRHRERDGTPKTGAQRESGEPDGVE